MQIINVKYANPDVQIKKANLSETNRPQTSYSMTEIPRGYGDMNRSLVSFRGEDSKFDEDAFNETLKDNYFKLNVKRGDKPDEYQESAAKALFQGKDVLVTAPTGTGKTAIAYYAISKNMADGKKTFYTTPLKALSNEKYKQLKAIFGEENVGILTGDKKEDKNGTAPIVVMTTEIYRNMVFGDKFRHHSHQLDNLKTVVFDEVHYLGDVDRGGIWDQSIILSDKDTQLLSLSATVKNHEDLNSWISKVKGKNCEPVDVPAEKRHVPLKFEVFSNGVKAKKVKLSKDAEQKQNLNSVEPPPDLDSYKNMLSELRSKKRLPAIFFVFSKKESRNLLKEFQKNGITLTDKDQQQKIKDTIARYKKEGKYLGESLDEAALIKGYAVHNAGILPSQKELIEELFQRMLVQVVISTETLAAGINMPAKTVVLSSTRKPTSGEYADGIDEKIELTSNEFHQMAGRAGRRGIDDVGYVYCMSVSKRQAMKYSDLNRVKSDNITSKFTPDYSLIAGYHAVVEDDEAMKSMLSKSFRAFDKNDEKSKEKAEDLFNEFKHKRNILKEFGFIKPDNSLTLKGELLSNLNGYEQIPLTEAIAGKKLEGLNAVELAACAGSLANMCQKRNQNLINEGTEKLENSSVDSEAVEYFETELDGITEEYNTKMADEKKFKAIEQDKKAARNLYNWAKMNSTSDKYRENWAKVYGMSKLEEGSLFKQITQTADLLKQICTMATAALNVVESDSDRKYYTNLKQTAQESIALLRQEPIIDKEPEVIEEEA